MSRLRRPPRPFEPYVSANRDASLSALDSPIKSGPRVIGRAPVNPALRIDTTQPLPTVFGTVRENDLPAFGKTGLAWIAGRPWWQWWVASIITLALLGGFIALLRSGDKTSDQLSEKQLVLPAEHGTFLKGSLREQWESKTSTRWHDVVATPSALVAMECTDSFSSESCVVRGRSLADGSQLWVADERQVRGERLLAIGDAVILTDREANSLTILNASDGALIQTLSETSLQAFSSETIVVDSEDTSENAEFSQHVLKGIRVSDAQVLWQASYVAGSTFTIGGDMQLPPGFELDDPHAIPRQQFYMEEETDVVVRDTDTGVEVARKAAEDSHVFGLFDDKLLLSPIVDGAVRTRDVVAYQLPDTETPLWTKSLNMLTGTQCGAFLCTTDAHIVRTSDFTSMWRGGGLVFTTTTSGGRPGSLLVGLGNPDKGTVRIVVIPSDGSDPTKAGEISRSGLLDTRTMGKYGKQLAAANIRLLYNLRCAATTDAVYCGAVVEKAKFGKWDYTE